MLPSEKCQYSTGRKAVILVQDLPHRKQQSCNIPKESLKKERGGERKSYHLGKLLVFHRFLLNLSCKAITSGSYTIQLYWSNISFPASCYVYLISM